MGSVETVVYLGFQGEYESDGEVVYAIVDGECIFSNTIIGATSSINAAENIVKAIIRDARLPKETIFYDLQTHLGYRSKKSGWFDFRRLHIDWEDSVPRVKSWERVLCPGKVRGIFSSFIGGRGAVRQVGFDGEQQEGEEES